VLWSINGDQEFFSNVLKLPHWNNYEPCYECDATQDSGPPCKRFRVILPHKQQWVLATNSDAAENPKSAHPLFSMPGTTTRMVRGDGLHILFTKGMYAHILGSILHIMCWSEPPGTRQRVKPCQRLGVIFEQVQAQYREQSAVTRLTNLKLSMFTSEDKPWKDHPFLGCKGGECKHLAPALLEVCKIVLDYANPLHKRMVSCLENLVNLVKVFDDAGVFLSPDEYARALEKAEQFLEDYSWLNKWACDNGRQHFHIVMKFHTFIHLVHNSRYLNPKFHWCFKSEDFVGRISRLAHSVSMGVRSTRISLKVSPKYRVMLHLRLTRPNFGTE